MKATRLAVPIAAAVVLSLMVASVVLASGPAPNPQSGRWMITADCSDGNSYTVAVENGGRNIGAGQIVGAFGHAILVHGTTMQVDSTQNLFLGSWESFHGIGHSRQAQASCVSNLPPYTVTVDDAAYGLPDGVFVGDLVLTTITFTVVLKV